MNKRVVISVLSAGLSLGLITGCGVDNNNNRMGEPQNVNYSPVQYQDQYNNDRLNNGRRNMNQNGNNLNNGINNDGDTFLDNRDDIPGTGGTMRGTQ